MEHNGVCHSDLSNTVIISCCASKVRLSHQTLEKACAVKHCIVRPHCPTDADNCSDIRLEVADFADDLMSV